MKQVLKIFILTLFSSVCFIGNAKNDKEITLTVSSDGPTKDDAIKNALRLAIEQAYGVFVSANTTILNDDLVKDEIVTISKGAIKEYSLISDINKGDNTGFVVTIKATVSLPHLIKYAKNHGSECEFAGNTFALQMRLFEMQKENEIRALENLIIQVQTLLSELLSWEIEVGDPKIDPEHDEYYLINSKIYALVQSKLHNKRYAKPFGRYFSYNSCFEFLKKKKLDSNPLADIIFSTLDAIGLTVEEIKNMLTRGQVVYGIYDPRSISELGYSGHGKYRGICFRDRKTMDLILQLSETIISACCNFVIVDNMGISHDIFANEIRHCGNTVPTNVKVDERNSGYVTISEDALFSQLYNINSISSGTTEILRGYYRDYKFHEICKDYGEDGLYALYFPGLFYGINDEFFLEMSSLEEYVNAARRLPMFKLTFRIPKSEIGKYSSFKIVRK